MTGTRLAAIVLIVVGALMLAFPVISYTTRDEVVDIGPLEVTAEDEHRVPLPPILGGAAIVIGLGLLFTGRRRSA
jgi:hypothetical protein